MTALHPTEPEPERDIAAQLDALLDSRHPKRALWVSRGSTLPIPKAWMHHFVHRLKLPQGTLYASEHDCGRLEDDPSEETLASILDYLEPKSGITARPAVWWPVVQARSVAGYVVWEQISSWERIGETMRRAMLYGRPAVCTMDEVLARRARLIAEEKRYAKGVQGCRGRGQAEARVPE